MELGALDKLVEGGEAGHGGVRLWDVEWGMCGRSGVGSRSPVAEVEGDVGEEESGCGRGAIYTGDVARDSATAGGESGRQLRGEWGGRRQQQACE
jgi:hypothetical protein